MPAFRPACVLAILLVAGVGTVPGAAAHFHDGPVRIGGHEVWVNQTTDALDVTERFAVRNVGNASYRGVVYLLIDPAATNVTIGPLGGGHATPRAVGSLHAVDLEEAGVAIPPDGAAVLVAGYRIPGRAFEKSVLYETERLVLHAAPLAGWRATGEPIPAEQGIHVVAPSTTNPPVYSLVFERESSQVPTWAIATGLAAAVIGAAFLVDRWMRGRRS